MDSDRTTLSKEIEQLRERLRTASARDTVAIADELALAVTRALKEAPEEKTTKLQEAIRDVADDYLLTMQMQDEIASTPIGNLESAYKQNRGDPQVLERLVRKCLMEATPALLDRAISYLSDARKEHSLTGRLGRLYGVAVWKRNGAMAAIRLMEQLIAEDYTEAASFQILGFFKYDTGDLSGAIRETERALQLFQDQEAKGALTAEERVQVNITKSNLAYYYADFGSKGLSEKAIALSHDAMNALRETPHYANMLDTYGYVLISFGKTLGEVKAGIECCREANRLGLREELLKKDIERAAQRLSDLSLL